MNGAKLLVDLLIKHDVDTVFGYPGATVLSVYDVLNSHKNIIKHIRTSHEQGAAHAADGYARASGKTGICLSTSGPGATNLVTGIAAAYMDSVPVIFITGNVECDKIGTDSFQEVDTTGITMPITKHNHMVRSIEELYTSVNDAFIIANEGRKGPVLIDIPQDILEQNISDSEYKKITNNYICYKSKNIMTNYDTTQLELAVKLINESKHPFILIGGGTVSSKASEELINFAEKINSPVSCTFMALGAMPNSHPLFAGGFSNICTLQKEKTFIDSDLFIAIGTRFSNRTTKTDKSLIEQKKVIHIDVDRAEINKNISSDCFLVGDAKKVLEILTDKINKKAKTDLELSHHSDVEISQNDELKPKNILQEIKNIIGEEAYIVTDVGLHQLWTAQFYPFEKPGHFITSGGFGAMGFGVGAAIGVHLGQKNKPVVLITGDGSFNMNCNELATVYENNIPLIIVLMHNNSLGLVRFIQKNKFKKRYFETTLKHSPNYVMLAKSYHIKGKVIRKMSDFKENLLMAKDSMKPFLLDCRIDINEA